MVSGPTGAGKTLFTVEALNHIQPPPDRTYWFYTQRQPIYDTVNAQFIKGLPTDMAPFLKGPGTKLIILDDLMSDLKSSRMIEDLCTKLSHHCNASVFILLQNFFARGDCLRTISLQTKYMALFKNPRDVSQIKFIGQQMFPGNAKYLIDAYKQATVLPHSYLFIDAAQQTPDDLRLSSDIFSENPTIYLPADRPIS
jgi:hypothetical protein